MPSTAASKYITAAGHIRTLRKAATDRRLRPMSQDEIQVYYHASLTAYVAAWEAYINGLVSGFYDVLADSSDSGFNAIYTIAQQAAERAVERFNTPNWENTRNLLTQCTGYDPINDWAWSRRGMDGLQVHMKLNEILQVRHSFAHGYDMPSTINWIRSSRGKIRLTSKAIQETEAFFTNLVNVTDSGMKAHINQTYGISNIW